MTILVFKQVPRDDKGHKFLYTLDFLDMKFTIAEHRHLNQIKLYAGWKQDDGSYLNLEDYPHKQWWSLTGLRKGEPTSREKVDLYIDDITLYIKRLYGFDMVETQVQEYMNLLIEQWLTEKE